MTAPVSATPDRERAGRFDPRSLGRGSLLNMAGAATAAVSGVAVVVAVTRGFSKAEAGVFFAATSVFLLAAAVAKLGTQTGLVYFISRFRALDTPQLIRRCVAVAVTPVVLAATLLGVALFVLAPDVAAATAGSRSGTLADYLRALAVFLPAAAGAEALLAATAGFGTMRPTALVHNIGRPLAQLLLILLAVTSGYGILLAVAWAGPYLPAAVVAALWLVALHRRNVTTDRAAGAADDRLGRSFWRYTAPRTVAGVAQIAMQRLDILLVAALRGPAEAALYTAATRFLVVGQLGGHAMGQAVQPQLGGLLAVGNRDDTRRAYQTSTSWLVLSVWPFYLLCATFAAMVMRLFGESYRAGSVVIVVLALSMLVATACGPVDTVLNMAGRTTWTLANLLVALAVGVGLDLLLIPTYGALGAAVGWAAAIGTKNLLALIQTAVALRAHPFGSGTLIAAVCAGGCFGLLPLAVRLAAGQAYAPVVAAAAVGMFAYACGCWYWRRPLQLSAVFGALRAARPGRGRPAEEVNR